MTFGGEERRQGPLVADMRSPTDFEMTARDVLAFLNQRLGFGLWMVTRVRGDDWIVLQARDFDFDVLPGMVFHWGDSYCIHMVQEEGPRIAPRSREIPAYAKAKLELLKPIEAYIGVPITLSNGELFGTLCAFDTEPQPDSILHDLKMVELFAAMLGKLVEGELKALNQLRSKERDIAPADQLTGLINSTGWANLFEAEEARCRRYGSVAAVISINLDGLKDFNLKNGRSAGDAALRSAANCLRESCRDRDIVARIGGDQFAVLLVECSAPQMISVVDRIASGLTASGILASIGCSQRDPSLGLEIAMADADSQMVVRKTVRRSAA